MAEGKYFFAKEGEKVFFKLTGNLKYISSGKFDAFLDQLLEVEKGFEDAMIDLSEAEYIDSTNLGFLARIAEFMSENYCKKVTIYSPNNEINTVLESVGFDEVFVIVKDEANAFSDIAEISPAEIKERERTLMMLEAHKALMRVSEKNIPVFKSCVELLQSSLDKKKEENQ